MPLGRGKNKYNDQGGENELDLVKATVTRVNQASSRALGDSVGKIGHSYLAILTRTIM